ncbi:hypothetical protein PYCC9005_002605 [Savitreella phatthalungensis]
MSDTQSLPGATQVSNRERKRLQKLARESKPMNDVETADSRHDDTGHASAGVGYPDDSADGNSIYLELLQKRLRALMKKKGRLDRLDELAHDVTKQARLNEDQRELLARRDQVLAPLRELQQLSEQIRELERRAGFTREATERERKRKEADDIEAARQEGRRDGEHVVKTLFAFLHHASILRESPSANASLNEAHERLLSIIYAADDTSLQAAKSLASKSEETVEGSNVTYRQLSEALGARPEEPEPKTRDAESLAHQETERIDLSPQITSPEDRLVNESQPGGISGISFLNESEIDRVSVQEESENYVSGVGTAQAEGKHGSSSACPVNGPADAIDLLTLARTEPGVLETVPESARTSRAEIEPEEHVLSVLQPPENVHSPREIARGSGKKQAGPQSANARGQGHQKQKTQLDQLERGDRATARAGRQNASRGQKRADDTVRSRGHGNPPRDTATPKKVQN